MEGIVDASLRYPDGDVLGIGLPDPLRKLCQTGAKLHFLGHGRLVWGGVYSWGDYIRHLAVFADDPRLAGLLLHQGKSVDTEEGSKYVDGVLIGQYDSEAPEGELQYLCQIEGCGGGREG